MNNILPLRYALEVWQTGSISQAAKNLYMGQPHLSKAIKELEDSLGIIIFTRTSKGVTVTPRGGEFLDKARNILEQIDDIEALYNRTSLAVREFEVTIPSVYYMSDILGQFTNELIARGYTKIRFMEASFDEAVNQVADGIRNIAVVRYPSASEKQFQQMLKKKKLNSDPIKEFTYRLLIKKDSPLSKKKKITPDDLSGYMEIKNTKINTPEFDEQSSKIITVNDRALQFDMLLKLKSAYIWVSDISQEILEKYGFSLMDAEPAGEAYKDVFICRRGYNLTENDISFVHTVRSHMLNYV